ncbi:MAG: thrombospondin type 3 repeat-containing protein [Planctomycetota bacterium]
MRNAIFFQAKTPLPLPGRADDYEKFAASCADDGRSPGASYAEGWSRFFVEAVAPAPGNIIEGPRNVQFLDAPCCPCGFREGYREEAWIARILWELYKEKPPPVIPGVDPGLYPFGDLALAIAGPGVGPPGDICAYQEALAALRGPDVRVVEIYRRNMVGVLQGGRCGGVPEDRDADGVRDAADNCPFVPNRAQEDEDGDGIGDACDGCLLADPGGVDLDYDGVGDRCEGPPRVSVEAAPSRGSPPLEVRLSGSAADPGGRAVSWTWDVDGVPAGEGPAIVVTITSVRLHAAVLRVVDDDGLEGSGAATIAVGFEVPVAGNVNGDLRIDISDPIALLSFLFLGARHRPASPSTSAPTRTPTGRWT